MGKSLSRLIAIESREAVRMPALPVVMKARRAATANITIPEFPIKVLAPSEIGVRELESSVASSSPTVIEITAT